MAEENGSNSDLGSQENLAADVINLEIEELDDAEYAIPAVDKLPSLESILAEPDCGSLSGTDDDVGAASLERLSTSETVSVGSLLSLNSPSRPKTRQPPPSGVILRHVILKGICAQVASASDKINAGLASAVAAGVNMLAIGTSHGLVLGFDSAQTLRWCHRDTRHQGSVSALCFNHDGTRILAGFAKGYILMIDSSNGKILRTLTDVHPPGTAVLHVKFTDSPKLALCSDSGGSVFELTFTRTMGVRGCDSKCLFSGSRGEVCSLEPLLLEELTTHPLKNYTLVAMATLSKVIVVCIRPRMRVVLTHPLNGAPIAPPQVAWQLVVIRSVDDTRIVDPVLALGRDNVIHFYQVCSEAGMRVRLMPLRRIILTYTMSNLRWMNSRSLAVLDVQEKLHLLDVRTQEHLETLDVSSVGLSYASSHFKGLSTGGNVSKAMALAGERACYNTVIVYGSQLLLLGMKSLHAICMRTWMERLRHLTMQKRYREALELGLDFYRDKGKAVVGLRGSKQRRKQIIQDKVCQVLIRYMEELSSSSEGTSSADLEIVSTCVEYCVHFESTNLLFGKLWDLVSESDGLKAIYLRSLESPLMEGILPPQLPPLIAQQMVTLYTDEDRLDSLQAIIILLNVDCLDIHQVTTICNQRGLWEALIHLQTAALGDYTMPIHQLVPILQKHVMDSLDSVQPWDCISLGNALLVYTSCCLTGRQFPRKSEMPEGLPRKVKADVLRALLSQHSSQASDAERQYPYLRTLLRFDAKGFLDAIAMAFQEPEFTSEMGLRQRQRIVDILFNIVTSNTPMSPENSDYLSNEQKIFVLIFIVDEVVECTVSLEPNSLYRIVEILCLEVCEHKSRRENALLKLLHGNKLTNIPETTLLNLTRKANFLRVSEMLYTNRGDWESVCECLMDDPSRHSEVLPLLQQLPTIQLNEIAKKHALKLVSIDSSGFAGIVATRLPDQMDEILEIVQKDPYCEYALLSALYDQTDYEKKDLSDKETADEEEEDRDSSPAKVQLLHAALERFLELMCEMEPDRVLKHLHGPYGCQPDRALEIVRKVSRKDAEAVLLEQSGNYQGAFDLLLGRLTEIINVYKEDESLESEAIEITLQISGICRRSAGVLDWLPLVKVVLSFQSNSDAQKNSNSLDKKLLKVILEVLSGTTALSSVLEYILKQPLSTGGTMGDIRQLLTGVLAQSRYEQVLVQTTAKLVSLELHEALKKSLREAGKARTSDSLICPVCRRILSNAANCIVIFSCNHTYHLECLSEPKLCYECLNTKGWANPVTDFSPPTAQSTSSRMLQERRKLEPPAFMKNKLTSLRLAPPVPWPDLEDVL